MKTPTTLLKLALVFSLFILVSCGGGTGETVQPTAMSENISQQAAVDKNIDQPTAVNTGARLPALLGRIGGSLTTLPPLPSFPVFDAMLYVQKPSTAKLGMSEIRVIYERELWNTNESHDQPNISLITQVASTLQPGSVVCVDIECWPVHQSSGVVNTANVQKYITVATTIKQVAPTVHLGFFGVLPVNNSGAALGLYAWEFRMWQLENTALQPLADAVDYIFPELYTSYLDPQLWKTAAANIIVEAKKYSKPVYPFLWPVYLFGNNRTLDNQDAGTLNGQYIPQDFWDLELATCHSYADGIVVWGEAYKWDASAPWWLSLQSLLLALNHHLKLLNIDFEIS